MKKLLSLLAILGLLGFVALPSYAQEEDISAGNEYSRARDDSYEYDGDNYEISESDYDYSNNGDNLSFSYPYDREDMSMGNMARFRGLGLGMMIFFYIAFIFRGITLLARGEVYRKAGKKLWAFLVPFRGTMVYSEIAGINKWSGILPWLYFIVAWCGGFAVMSGSSATRRIFGIIVLVLWIATLVRWIMANYRVARRFGWEKSTSVLHVLFTPITTLILGLGNYKYDGKSGKTDA